MTGTVKELRLRMLKQTEDMLNEARKKLDSLDSDRAMTLGKIQALTAVRLVLIEPENKKRKVLEEAAKNSVGGY